MAKYRARLRAEAGLPEPMVNDVGAPGRRLGDEWAEKYRNMNLSNEVLTGIMADRLLVLSKDPESSPRDLRILAEWIEARRDTDRREEPDLNAAIVAAVDKRMLLYSSREDD